MNGATTVLVVEDEAKLAAVLAEYLGAAGFATHCVGDGIAAIAAVRSLRPGLLLLDLNLPRKDGLQVCQEVRSFSAVPIILLTARVEEIDRLIGLDSGADDYVCKPFSPREVVARVRAILRRVRPDPDAPGVPGLQLDESAHRACYNGVDLNLTAVEFRLLAALARAPGRVYSRDQLLSGAYPDHRLVSDRTIDSHIKNLRRKLDLANADHELVRSVYGVGYKIQA